MVGFVVYLSYRQFSSVEGVNRPEAWGKCEAASDCIKVDEFCGAISTINKKFAEAHNKSFNGKTGGCTGNEDFSAQKLLKPDCVGNRCVLVP